MTSDPTGTTWFAARAYALAPNNMQKKSSCLSKALAQNGNGTSLALDVAGDFAAFIPGGGLVTTTSAALARTGLGVQAGLGVASTVHSLAVGSAPGAALGILGGQATFTAAAAEKLAVGLGKSIPVVGLFFNLGATALDGIQTYQAYSACLSDHS